MVTAITGASKIDIVGLCLGGALTGMLAAYLTAQGDDRIGSVTLLNTLLDYSEPGVLGVFTDEGTVSRLERQMAATGFLEGDKMAATFDMLRANDLIFGYVVSNWLTGQRPPPFDILAWNGDSTRMPAAMHSFYLRSLYLRNELAKGELELAGSGCRCRRSKPTPTSSARSTTTSCPGRPPTRPPTCSTTHPAPTSAADAHHVSSRRTRPAITARAAALPPGGEPLPPRWPPGRAAAASGEIQAARGGPGSRP